MKTFTLPEMITSLRDMAAQILTEESNGKALFNAIADELERIPPPMSNEFVAPGCEQFSPPRTYNEIEHKLQEMENILPQREQQLRKALERVKDLENYAKVESAKLAEVERQRIELQDACECALSYLLEAGSGKQYDPSWIRPKTMTREQVNSACEQAYHRLHKALEVFSTPTTPPKGEAK